MGRSTLTTTDGKKVRLLHPGWKNTDSGPDFRDALITIDGERLKGDIEIHVNSRHWQAHGHHRDPGFDDVILHVVMWNEGEESSLLHNKERIPILALSPHLKASIEGPSNLLSPALTSEEPCRRTLKQAGMSRVLTKINKAGERRFCAKAAGFRNAMTDDDPEQVLYVAMMGALGYTKNRESFEMLAQLLPLTSLRALAVRASVPEIETLMLRAAGLLPCDLRPKAPAIRPRIREDVETAQETCRSFHITHTMCRGDWRFFRIRPENYPTRRIAAASHLLARCRGELLRSVLTGLSRPSVTEARRELERSLIIEADGGRVPYRRSVMGSGGDPHLIGQNRARDIIVNVLLPFFFAWADIKSDAWLRKQTTRLYVKYPRLQENWITRYMERQIFGGRPDPALPHGACYQQGLIQLYRAFCTDHRCKACPLARRDSPRHGQSPSTGYLPDAEPA